MRDFEEDEGGGGGGGRRRGGTLGRMREGAREERELRSATIPSRTSEAQESETDGGERGV